MDITKALVLIVIVISLSILAATANKQRVQKDESSTSSETGISNARASKGESLIGCSNVVQVAPGRSYSEAITGC